MARILGLDICPTALRATLLRTSLRNLEIERSLEVPIPPATDPQGRAEGLLAALETLSASLGRAPDSVVVAVDGREASVRTLELPAGAAKRVAEVIPFELDELLPFEVSDAVVTHQPIDRTPTLLRVLAAAVPKARVSTLLAELAAAKLEPREIAVGAVALDGLRHVVPALEAPGPLLLVSLGTERMDLCVLEKGACTFARTTSGGLDLLSRGRQAELAATLRRTLAAYRAANHPPVRRVYLGGDGALYAESILPWLQEVTDAEASLVPIPGPLEMARKKAKSKSAKDAPKAPEGDASAAPEGVDVLAPDATPSESGEPPRAPSLHPAPTDEGLPERAKFAYATALAARAASRAKRLDLRQGELAYKQAMGNLRAQGKLIAIASAPVILAFLFATWARWSVLSGERETLQAQLAEVTREVFSESTRDPSQARTLLEGGRRIADPIPRFTAWAALDALTSAIPTEIQHDTRRLTIEVDDETRQGRMEIQGLVASLAERDTIAANVEAHECFNEIKRGPTSPGPNNTGLNYRLEATLHCPGDEPMVQPATRGGRRN